MFQRLAICLFVLVCLSRCSAQVPVAGTCGDEGAGVEASCRSNGCFGSYVARPSGKTYSVSYYQSNCCGKPVNVVNYGGPCTSSWIHRPGVIEGLDTLTARGLKINIKSCRGDNLGYGRDFAVTNDPDPLKQIVLKPAQGNWVDVR